MRDDPRYKLRRACANAVHRAIKAGRLVRPDRCERCGEDPGKAKDGRPLVQAHHEDYSRPLEVRWLCTLCHALEHRKQESEGVAA